MKENNSQLTDAMIIALADAYDTGVNFSVASQVAKIPEVAIVEANEYWQFLTRQNIFLSTMLPEESIIDSLFAKLDTVSPEVILKESTPSPYMKYMMIFAAPLSILVMILGISFREQSVIDVATNPGDAKTTVSSNITAPLNSIPASAPASIVPTSNIMAARSAQIEIAPEVIANEDPKQLFAMLSEAGTQEAQSDIDIDDQYDAQLSALDSKVIDSDNPNTYAPL